MNQKNKIQVFQSIQELTETAGKFILKIANDAVAKKGRFTISLSGGHTPEQLYILLSKSPFKEQFPWTATFVFWGDERCVASDDQRKNATMAQRLLLDQVNIPEANIYPIPVALMPSAAANQYEYTIRTFYNKEAPVFDLILLGLGENGHTASLFPDSNVNFENTTNLVQDVYVAEQEMFRVTMTANLINQADNIIFLVTGPGKAEILNTVLTTAYQPEKYPAQLIKPATGNLYWFVDEKAAALLPDKAADESIL